MMARPGSLGVSLLEVADQYFDPADFSFRATYKLELRNNNMLLRKRIKYPSICIVKNGKMMECDLVDMNGNHIEVLTIPAKKAEIVEVKVEESNPPFTDIGPFTYDLTYYVRGSKRPRKSHILQHTK